MRFVSTSTPCLRHGLTLARLALSKGGRQRSNSRPIDVESFREFFQSVEFDGLGVASAEQVRRLVLGLFLRISLFGFGGGGFLLLRSVDDGLAGVFDALLLGGCFVEFSIMYFIRGRRGGFYRGQVSCFCFILDSWRRVRVLKTRLIVCWEMIRSYSVCKR